MKNKALFTGFSAVVLSVALGACAHKTQVDQKVEAEISAQAPVGMGAPMAEESRKLILESKEITQTQKDRLLALHSKVMTEMIGIREEEGKLKMVFFKTLLDPKADEREIANLRRRILTLDRRKTDKMLGALEEAQGILGRMVFKDERFFRAFLMDRRSHGDLF